MEMEQQARILYQKAAYCKRAVMVGVQLDKKDILDSKDAMLRLHQSLATLCARATPRVDGRYVVQTEVVACHIESAALRTPGGQKELPLWLAKNTAWDQADRAYVSALLAHLQEIGRNCTVANVHSKGRLSDLTSLIYGYLKDKVWSRLGKLVLAMQALSTLPQAIRESKERLELRLKAYEEKKNSLNFRLWRLADASNYCRKYPMSSEDARTWPLMVKRWNKLASYSAAFNNVVTWALGAGSYKKYKDKFLDGQKVTYYKPLTRKTDDFTRKTLDDHYSPAYKTENAKERQHKIDALAPLDPKHKERDEEIFVHAEMHMAPSLAHDKALKEDQYIGISKPCCFLCFAAIRSLNGPNKIVVKGTHNKLYPKWMIPQTSPSNKITMEKEELKNLEKKLDEAIVKEIHRKVGLPSTADSIWNSQNTDDIDAQPEGPPKPA